MFGITEIDAPALQVWMQGEPESFLLVDVRSMSEMAYGMLPGAAAMPMHLIPVRIQELQKAKKIVFYCQTGARSGQVCAFLQQQGFDKVFNLRGGIVDWSGRGYAVETPQRRSLAG